MGRIHKKKIAEHTASETEKTDYNDDESHNSDVNGDLESAAETNGENGGTTKTPKKRKGANAGENENGNGEEEIDPPKKAKKGASKKKGKGKAAAAQNEQVEEEEIDNDEPEYEVKDIVDHKLENGISYFLVRWKGYTKDDDTWEPEDTLSCNELIAKFQKKKSGNDKKVTKEKDGKKGKKTKAVHEVSTEEYEVEKIINYAEEKDGRLFLIRWKGYSAKHDTWEPEANLNCSDMIEKFMQRMKTLEHANFKELREEPKKTKRLVNETAPRSHYTNPTGRTSKRASKKRVYYGDSDN